MTHGSLTDRASVKRLARFTNEVTNDDLDGFIDDVSTEIYNEYGFPLATSRVVIDEDKSKYFIFPWFKQGGSVWRVDRVLVDGSILTSGSFTVDTGSATVTLAGTLNEDRANKIMHIGYVPNIIKRLATFKVAFDVVQSTHLIASEGEGFPRTAWIKQRIEQMEMNIGQQLIELSNKNKHYIHEEGEYVFQDDIGSQI